MSTYSCDLVWAYGDSKDSECHQSQIKDETFLFMGPYTIQEKKNYHTTCSIIYQSPMIV